MGISIWGSRILLFPTQYYWVKLTPYQRASAHNDFPTKFFSQVSAVTWVRVPGMFSCRCIEKHSVQLDQGQLAQQGPAQKGILSEATSKGQPLPGHWEMETEGGFAFALTECFQHPLSFESLLKESDDSKSIHQLRLKAFKSRWACPNGAPAPTSRQFLREALRSAAWLLVRSAELYLWRILGKWHCQWGLSWQQLLNPPQIAGYIDFFPTLAW